MMIKSLLRNNWLFLIIFVLAAILRFYRLPEMAYYDYDQEFVTQFVYEVTHVYPIRYIGQGLSIQGLFMGPWFFYLMVPFYLLTGGQPLGGFIGSVLLGLLTIGLYYWVGKRMFSQSVGLLAALLRAVTYYAITTDWLMIPSQGSDGLVIIFWWLLYELWRKKWWALPSLALVCGLFTSFHPIHVPLWGVLLILIIVWKVKAKWWVWLASLGLFILPSAPLILFEYWRKGAMIQQLVSLIQNNSGGVSLMSRLSVISNMVVDFMEMMLMIPEDWIIVGRLIFVVFVGLLFYIWRQQKMSDSAFHGLALTLTVGLVIGYYTVFPANVPEYYLGSVRALLYLYLPVILIYVAGKSLFWKLGVIAILVWIGAGNLRLLSWRWQREYLQTSYYHKQRVVDKIVERAGSGEFALSKITDPGYGWGFESLLMLKNHSSAGVGQVYTVVVPTHNYKDIECDFTSGAVGLIYPESN